MHARAAWHSIVFRIKRRIHLARLLLQHDPVYLTALVTYFGHTLGGYRSQKSKLPTTDDGQAVPWYTYPALTYLQQLDISRFEIFEYGAGNSSTYWANRAQSVISVETDPHWYETILQSLAANQKLTLCADRHAFVQAIHATGQQFDLIIVDAQWRYDCALEALTCLRPGGLIILDNSDWYPRTAALLRASGLAQIDFVGWGPINTYAWCTSFFVRELADIPRIGHPVILVPGGIKQIAADDRSAAEPSAT